ncbi:ABC transporter permease [Microbacterium sp. JB110]|uniref:ABC transporter permease n=1 Tax=Microbacterium sp. JB110 TaxID=2024477 RepID=UPI00097F0C62|nr:ABC transporter permease [Microbacterium sp. JB110]RCS57991.1 ABC transporter permease [Microbacterium sp. JB110]SJM55616.1 ABC transporter, permease protein [Frigoribacterium sp. JB110]
MSVAIETEQAAAPQESGRGPTPLLRERGMGASVLVAALSAGFGVVLLTTTGYLADLLTLVFGNSGTLAVVIAMLAVVFVVIAMYVGAIVTSNTFSTVVAGRTRQIALMRLIGASARSQRSAVARQGLAVGALGATIGLIAGLVLSAIGTRIADAVVANQVAGAGLPALPAVDYNVLQPWVLLPTVAVVLTTWLAAWVGSRRVLDVTPLQALGGATPRSAAEARGGVKRNVGSIILLATGFGLLGLGVALGLRSPLGLPVAFLGGLLSFTGLVTGATFVMPPVLRLVGRMFGRTATARMAAENALRYPERSSRMAIGVVVGVTLVTMFAVATESAKSVLIANSDPGDLAEGLVVLDMFSAVMMGLVAVAAVIAAVGLVNLLTIGVVQRRTELGLLRAIGLSNPQIRRMVLLEAAHVTIAAVLFGLLLGAFYGWAGAQSLLGAISLTESPAGSLVVPAVPWLVVAVIVVATAVLTLVAAVGPTRLATRVSPVEALAAD